MAVRDLLERQNPDGGWPYRHGPSRMEPTIFALLALYGEREGASSAAAGHATGWLRANQRPDGGWAPAPSVDQSTWVTALALLLPPVTLGPAAAARAAAWLLRQEGEESRFFYRCHRMPSGEGGAASPAGWPWFPGSAGWVIPTAVALLGLARVRHSCDFRLLRDRIAQGAGFLLAHRCGDGGWNHGSARALNYEGSSYPEVTGLALLALGELPSPDLASSLAAAERHLRGTRSAEAVAWLHLGLRAHGRDPGRWPDGIRARTVYDLALSEWAQARRHSLELFPKLGEPGADLAYLLLQSTHFLIQPGDPVLIPLGSPRVGADR